MRNYDKSLIEVWGWKDKVYEEVKGLSGKEYVEKIGKDAQKLLVSGSIRLKSVSVESEHQRTS